MKRGDQYVAYGNRPHRQRLYIFITRVAKDGSWADIAVHNCMVMWTKRQPLFDGEFSPTAETVRRYWSAHDLDEQFAHWDDEVPA